MRSWLFVPGNVKEKIYKAINSAADVVIIDLEDSVPPAEKESARELSAAIVSSLGKDHRKIYLRVNAQKEWFEQDVISAVSGDFDGIIVPKISCTTDIINAEYVLSTAEANTDRKLDLIPLIESAEGVLNIRDIFSVKSRVKRVTFGVLDYLLDIGGKMSPDGFESSFARSYISLASAAAGKEGPIDTVFPAYKDDNGFFTDATRARCLGYQGKLLIHPNQIEAANKIFSPDDAEIKFAEKAIFAYEEAEAMGLAAVKVDGRMVDKPVYLNSLSVIKRAEEYGMR